MSEVTKARSGPSALTIPRRIVLLQGDDTSEVELVLIDFPPGTTLGKAIHAELQRQADQLRGRWLALEWLGPLGWVRFSSVRKEPT